MPRQEIRHLSGSGPRPARPSVRIGDCTARAGNGRKRTIPGRRAGHWRRGQLQDLSRGRRPPAPGRAPGLPRPPLHGVGQPVRYDGNRRVHSNRPSGPKERFLSCSPTSGCSLGNGSPLLSRSGGRAPFRGMEPQIASTDAANSLYLQPISPRSTIACCRD